MAQNGISECMSFTSNSSGGNYDHNHGYAISYGEYFGTITDEINLENSTRSGVSWKKPEKISYQVQHKRSNVSSSTSSATDQYVVYAGTRYSDSAFPYITVYFWKRTA